MFYVRTCTFLCEEPITRNKVDLSDFGMYLCSDINSPIGNHYYCQQCGTELSIDEVAHSLHEIPNVSETTINGFVCKSCLKLSGK
jgi:hypothetical protein